MSPDRTDLSDEGLALRARSGETDGLAELARRYVPRVFHLLARVLEDPRDAEHVTVDAFLEIGERVSAFDHARGFRPWLFAVTWRHASMELARRERGVGRILSLESHRPDDGDGAHDDDGRSREASRPCGGRPAAPSGASAVTDEAERVRRALAALAPRCRALLLLREVEDLSYAELARVFRTKPRRIRCELRQARFGLQDALHDHHPEWRRDHPFADGDRRCGRRAPDTLNSSDEQGSSGRQGSSDEQGSSGRRGSSDEQGGGRDEL